MKMRMLNKLLIVNLGLLLASSAFAAPAATPEAGKIPKDWFVLPENTNKPIDEDGFNPSTGTDQQVSSSFQVQANAMDEIASKAPAASGAPFNKDNVHWYLAGVIADFGLSVGGAFGPMFYEGEPAVKVTWTRKDAGLRPIKRGTLSHKHRKGKKGKKARRSDLVVRAGMTRADVSRELEPSVRAALATGRIRDEAKFRETVSTQGQRFFELCQGLEKVRVTPRWTVESFQLELGIDASGEILEVATVGTAVSFRFQWDKADSDSREETPQGEAPQPATGDHMKRFTEAVLKDIDQTSQNSPKFFRSDYDLDEIKVGVGISAEGDIGLAHGLGSISGAIIFSKEENPEVRPATPESEERFVNLISTSKESHHHHFAFLRKIPFKKVLLFKRHDKKDEKVEGTMYRIGRDRFRKGLARALRMGKYFAKKAGSTRSTRWLASEVEVSFEASVGGTLGLTTVNTTAEVELGFSKKDEN